MNCIRLLRLIGKYKRQRDELKAICDKQTTTINVLQGMIERVAKQRDDFEEIADHLNKLCESVIADRDKWSTYAQTLEPLAEMQRKEMNWKPLH